MRLARAWLALLLGLVAAFFAVTRWVLESGGVAIVETRAPDGNARRTHVWFAESGDELWLEAGTPENAWFVDAQRDPLLRLSAAGRSGRYRAEPIAGSAHARIRVLLREKYGWRDAWVGLLVDTSRSVAVRLQPAPE